MTKKKTETQDAESAQADAPVASVEHSKTAHHATAHAAKSKTHETKAHEPKSHETKEKHEHEKKADKHEKHEKVVLGIQPEINIGLVGHVDHGKTTLVKALSGKWTDTHSEEVKRGITIRLGYADSTFVKTSDGEYTTDYQAKEQKKEFTPIRKVSFVDAPGHESLMATMLAGATIMDGALLLVAANQSCPQPQTREHVMALEIMGINNVVVVQNKIDVVSEEQAIKNYNDIKKFLSETKLKNAPIIPVSAQHNINIDILIHAICEVMPVPSRDSKLNPIMFVARSFDTNKPGAVPNDIVGGVLGGSLKQGELKIGDVIQIKPGYGVEEMNQRIWKPIETKVTGLVTGGIHVEKIGPGGSVGVMTMLDPSVVKSDSLTGSIVGLKGTLPETLYDIVLETHLLPRVVGSKEDLIVEPIKLTEILMLNVNSSSTVGQVVKLGKNEVTCKLKIPICAEEGARITISRRVGSRFRLIGYGVLK